MNAELAARRDWAAQQETHQAALADVRAQVLNLHRERLGIRYDLGDMADMLQGDLLTMTSQAERLAGAK